MIESLNTFSGDWATWCWRVTWQAALVIAAAWLIALLLRRSSPRLRSWIWRLAYLKLLVLMVWTTPVRLAVLPAAEGSGFGIQVSRVGGQESGASGQESEVGSLKEIRSQQTDLGNQLDVDSRLRFSRDAERNAEQKTDHREFQEYKAATVGRADADSAATIQLAWQSYLLLAWLVGVALVALWLSWEILRATKLLHSVQIIERADLASNLAEVCDQLRMRDHVRIGESELAGSPMLVKFWKPTIVFPQGMLQQLNAQEIRLALAHELAHLKRHDLAWNALTALVNVVLYFHPLAWLAHRSSRQEQEMACDELVVTRLGIERYAYGKMLMKVVRRLSRNIPTGMAVVGMASSYPTVPQ